MRVRLVAERAVREPVCSIVVVGVAAADAAAEASRLPGYGILLDDYIDPCTFAGDEGSSVYNPFRPTDPPPLMFISARPTDPLPEYLSSDVPIIGKVVVGGQARVGTKHRLRRLRWCFMGSVRASGSAPAGMNDPGFASIRIAHACV